MSAPNAGAGPDNARAGTIGRLKMPRSVLDTRAFVAVIGLAVMISSAGCIGGSSGGGLPSWIPDELAGLTIRPDEDGDRALTGEEATEAVRTRLFRELRASPEEEPRTFAVRVTGRVQGTGLIPISPTGQTVSPTVENHPAWLVIWRGVKEQAFDPPFSSPPNGVVDLAVFVDAETGEILRNVFLSGDARLR